MIWATQEFNKYNIYDKAITIKEIIQKEFSVQLTQFLVPRGKTKQKTKKKEILKGNQRYYKLKEQRYIDRICSIQMT